MNDDAAEVVENTDDVSNSQPDNSQESSNTLSPFNSYLPKTWRETFAVILLIAVADFLIYRQPGFFSFSLFIITTPLLILFGRYRSECSSTVILSFLLLIVTAAKLCWSGNPLLVMAAVLLLFSCVLGMMGVFPFLHRLTTFILVTIPLGLYRTKEYSLLGRSSQSSGLPGGKWLSTMMPLAVGALFAFLFVMANPDVLSWVSTGVSDFFRHLQQYLSYVSVEDFLFWSFIGVLGLGMLSSQFPFPISNEDAEILPETHGRSDFFAPFRNTLLVVIVLFTAYLGFEFSTLWGRTFPVGFHYSGYAHEGAAWLTVALSLATVVLSVIFRGEVLVDPRLGFLKKLAWVWSAQNLILAIAVYNRLWIYVGFNGMTRMRVIGYLGITAVVIGFALVLYKIGTHRSFQWLIKRQLMVPVLLCLLYLLLPVDILVHRYNVSRILTGDLAPTVQISVHPMTDDAYPELLPLLNIEDVKIRDGIAAMLIAKQRELADHKLAFNWSDWKQYQLGQDYTKQRLQEENNALKSYQQLDETTQAIQLEDFKMYVYQWF